MQSRRRTLIGALVAVGLLSVLVSYSLWADFSLKDWRYFKPITLPSDLDGKEFVELLPDSEVFGGSSSNLVDLRIIADDGTETPYKFEVRKGDRQQTPFSVALRDKGYVPGLYTMFTADLGRSGVLHNEIAFDTPSANFRRTAIVETSEDGATWAQVVEQQVYDFTVKERNFTTRDTHVKYPDNTARYVRVQIADEGEGPLEITGATVFLVKETPAQEVRWPTHALDTSRDSDRRATLVELDMGTRGIPTYRMAFRVADVNFYREVTVEASADRTTWDQVRPRDAIFAYDTPKFVGTDLAITYPEVTSRYLRLTIHDEDSPPLDIQGVEVWGVQRRLVFEADPNQSYKIYYGSADARRPSYDIEQIFPYLETEELTQVQLGPQATNPQFVEKRPPVSERFPWLLPAAIAVVALVVALILLGVIRQARKVLPPPS